MLSNIIFLTYFVFTDFTIAYWHVSDTIEEENIISDLKLDFNEENKNILKFTASGKQFDLPLASLNDIFSPKFQLLSANTLPNGESKLEELKDSTTPLKGSFYQVLPTQGVVYLDKTEDSYQVEGIIDDDKRLVIDQPNSYKLVRLSWKNTTTPSLEDDHDFVNSINHQVIKRALNSTTNGRKNKVIIETLVILDEATIKRLEAAKFSITKYLGIYWNSVRRRYADIKHPQIDFVLVGAIKADPKMIAECTYKKEHLNGYKLLKDLSHWLYNAKKKLTRFDIAMLQSSLDLASQKDGVYSSNLLGRAYVGGVCHIDDDKRRINNCGIGEDIAPAFTGVLTTAHEIAHLLGVPHDGTGFADACPTSLGYIMGRNRHDAQAWHFSSCSKKIMRDYLTYEADCVGDSPKYHIKLENILPGEIASINEVCKVWYGQEYTAYLVGTYGSNICNKVWCATSTSTQTFTFGAPPEGTSCGNNKFCIEGKCVDKK